MDTDKIKTKFKRLWEDNPVIVIMVGSAVANTAIHAAKAMAEVRNSKSWAKEVDRRDRMTP